MDDAVTYGWLSNCALAPAIGALSVWILFMFNIYRSEWRNVDIFLVLITIQQLLSCSSIFAYSLVNIIRSRVETSCNLTVWSLTTLRIFQLSTIGSLAMDRALTLKWPYKYRFSVRSNQICYHIVVLALMSGLVGVAGVFARVSPIQQQQSGDGRSFTSSPLPLSPVTISSSPSSPPSSSSSSSSLSSSTVPILTTTSPLSGYPQTLSTLPFNHTQSAAAPVTLIVPMSSSLNHHHQVCSLNPLSWDIRFNLFFTCLCGLLTLVTLSSFVYIECNRDTNDDSTKVTPKSKMLPNSRISSFGDLAIDHLGSNEAITKTTNSINSKYHHSPSSMGSNGGGNEGVGVGVGVVSVNSGTTGTGTHNSLQRFYSISNKEESVNNNHHHQHHHHQNHNHNHHGNSNILNHIRSSDMRWAVVVAITSLSYAVNQGPSLIFMFVGMIVPHFWTPLHDNVITWFALIEGFLLPISLYLTDDNFRDAVKLSFRRHRSSSSASSGGSCSNNQEKYKPYSGIINKPGFAFHYNDFVLIDKPYLGLMKSSEAKRSPSTLNLVSSSRSPYPGRHSTDQIKSNQPNNSNQQQSNNRPNVSSSPSKNKSSSGPFSIGGGVGNHSKGQLLARKSSHLSYIMSTEFCKKQQQQPGFSFDSPSVKRFGPFFANHNSTLNSYLTRSDDSIRKEKVPSSLARLSPMAWSINGDNWHFSTVDRKLASAMKLNDGDDHDNDNTKADDNGKGRLIGKVANNNKRKSESKETGGGKNKERRDADDGDYDDDGEHIYATLKVRSIGDSNSDDYGWKEIDLKPAQLNSMINTDNASGFDDASVSRLSFTTNANDDFEFHDTRESGSTIYTKAASNFALASNAKLDEESGDSTSSGEDASILTSDSYSTSDSESDNQQNQRQLKSSSSNCNSKSNLISGNHHHHQHQLQKIPQISRHQNRLHYASQLLPGPNHQINHIQMDKGNLYANKTANLIAANPMLGYNRNKSRSSSQITNTVGATQNELGSNENRRGEEKRRGWQFFSASDLHSIDNRSQEPNMAIKQDSHFINPLSKIKNPFDGHIIEGAIGSRRTMSETNLLPGQSISQLIQQQQKQQQLIYGSRDAGLYHLTRPTHNRIHLPFDPHYPQHLNQQYHHDTNTSTSTNSSGNNSGVGDHNKRFANLIMLGGNGDRRLERISSFSKNRPRIRAQKYQLYSRKAKRQESIKELSVDYRRNCIGSRLSLTQQDLISGPSEQLGAFVSVKSMPDLTINSYLPIYDQLSSIKK